MTPHDDFDLNNFIQDPVNYADLGEGRLVDFDVVRLPSASVVYLSSAWFFSHGLDICDTEVRSKVEEWLLDNFGVAEINVNEGEDCDLKNKRTLSADRYGLTGGALNGGSGRAGVHGLFNGKGIGPTPLVSSKADWYHSHGSLWLEEAMRETICSEVLINESRIGAQPIIAVIDLGIHLRWPDGRTGDRRAVIVRPNFIRVGHLQRSVHFGTNGFRGSDQWTESRCVLHAAAKLFAQAPNKNFEAKRRTLLSCISSTGSQIAYLRFHRLWPGPYTSANYTIDGKPVDFGGFRALSDWKQFQDEHFALPFGMEQQAIVASFYEVAQIVRKIGGYAPDIGQICRCFESVCRRVFMKECIESVSLQANIGFDREMAIVEQFDNIYKCEQEVRIQNFDPQYDDFEKQEHDIRIKTMWIKLIRMIVRYQREAGASRSSIRISLKHFYRIFLPRKMLVREHLVAKGIRLLRSRFFERADKAALVTKFIENVNIRSRRLWPGLPKRYTVIGQGLIGPLHYAKCIDIVNAEESFLWVEAPIYKDTAWIGDYIAINKIQSSLFACRRGNKLCLLINERSLGELSEFSKLSSPKLKLKY